jgi:hypothetical protein
LFLEPSKMHASVYHTLTCTIIYEAMLLSDLKNKFKEFESVFNMQPLDLTVKIDFWTKFGIDFKMPKP